MMAPDRFAAFLAVAVALIAVPGPSVLFIVSRAVTLGRWAAVLTAVGNEAGLMVQVILVAFGLGSVLERSQLLFSVLKFAGALYLVYLGVQTWRHRRPLTVDQGTARPSPTGLGRVLRDGFVVGVSNPKGLLIFSAALPQFVDHSSGNIPAQLLLLGTICVVIALVSDTAWGLLAGTARVWLTRSPRRMATMGGASGVIMVGLGVRLAFTDQH